eukprot:UN26561
MNLLTNYKLKQHINTLKDYFCCFNGAFWQVFFDEALLLFNDIPGRTADRDINLGPWSSARMKMKLEDNSYFKRLNLSYERPNFHATKRRIIDLNCLTMFGNGKVFVNDKTKKVPIVFRPNKENKNGAMTCKYKMPVIRGFECTLRFAFSQQNPTSFGFIIQNDRSDWLFTADDTSGCNGMLYSLSMLFKPIKDGKLRIEIIKTGHFENNKQTLHTSDHNI